MNIFDESESRKVQKLLTEMELGDRRRTALLRKIKALAGQSVAEPFLKSLFLQLIPSNVRNILAASNDTLRVLATMADQILEASNYQPSYGDAAVSPAPQSEEMNKKFEELYSDLIHCIEKL